MPVPFIDLTRLTRELSGVTDDWKECLEKCEFVGGPRVAQLERDLEKALGVPHVASCANGTDAIMVGLQAMGIKPGQRVALPNLTFWATYEAIVQIGAVPVLVDIDPNDCAIDKDELVRAHDQHRFDAVVLVHLFGWTSARLPEIRALCTERNIRLLEDGAQAIGVEAFGEPILARADVGTLSFYPAKVVGGAMDGGAITMQSKETESLVRSLCNHGRSDHYSYAHVGWNSRMGGIQAAFLRRVVALMPSILASRRKAAEFYRQRLHGKNGIEVLGPPKNVVENGYLSVVRVAGKSGIEITEALKAKGIGTARTYPETLDEQPPAKGSLATGDLRHSKAFCKAVVNLPLFYGIREDECEAAASALMAVT